MVYGRFRKSLLRCEGWRPVPGDGILVKGISILNHFISAGLSEESQAQSPRRNMSLQIYIDGKFYAKEEAKISVFDHGLLYGDGVFEGIRSYSGRVFRLHEHLDRLWDSATAIAMEIPMTREAIADAIHETLKVNGFTDAYIRLVVTRGAGDLGLNPCSCPCPTVIVIADKIRLYPAEYYENGMELVTASTIRNHPLSLSPRIKSLNYLNNILAKIEGMKAGCVEALMTNTRGEVAECTGDNIFIVKGGRLLTPPVDAGILEGVTRNFVMELAREEGITVAEIPLTKYDMYVAEECFLTGTAAEVIPVTKLDGRSIGSGRPGPVTRQLIERFRTEIHREK